MYGPNCNTPPTRLSLLHFKILPLAKGTTPLGSMRRGVYYLFNWDNFGGHFMVHYVFILLISLLRSRCLPRKKGLLSSLDLTRTFL